MRRRAVWIVAGLLCAGAALWWWRGHAGRGTVPLQTALTHAAPAAAATPTRSAFSNAYSARLSLAEKEKLRLSNTPEKGDSLLANDHAILLANAVIDTRRPLSALAIPDALRSGPDNRSWLVQARGTVTDPAFLAALRNSGAEMISYFPNNAELVRMSPAAAQQLAGNSQVAAVVPYEPYYKLVDPGLLKLAVAGTDLPSDVGLRVGVYAADENATLAALAQMRAEVTAQEPSPFGTVLTVHPAAGTFLSLARLDGIMAIEAAHSRVAANDLTRVRLGIATNTTTNAYYLGLNGSGITINANDSGVDTNHPDLAGRVILDSTASATDPTGHGTHTIATMIGNGSQSSTVGTNAKGSATNANFAGMAPNASAFVIGVNMDPRPMRSDGTPVISDAYLQETAGRSNGVFISGNPWNYNGDAIYDMAAASFDASVRDAVPGVPGSQSLAYVFPAGNFGGGATDGSGGTPDTIWSPGTAKNVITVGALEQQRKITNYVTIQGTSNQVFLSYTDSSNQVAYFSGRGNVGVGIESGTGRFKPDVVAPGVFVLSAKPTGSNWDQGSYYNPTNVTGDTQFNQSVESNGLMPYSFFVPLNAVAVAIVVQANNFSLSPFPNMPIYAKVGDNPDTNSTGGYDFLSTSNVLVLPVPGGPLVGGSQLFYSIANGTNQIVNYDVTVLVESTNDTGNYLTVLSNLNSNLGQYYRYESGTSMSVAAVTGTLALMQQFLEQRMGVSNHSPALMKALLINGARTVASQYDFQVNGTRSSQGWGLPNLSNSIPGSLTNTNATKMPMQFFDQSPTNALATGQSKTRFLTLATNANSQPLRFTLVWTDPPGNPAAGMKLVNSLELIVTNLDNPTNRLVFYGNDIPAGSAFNQSETTSNAPVFDLVNNVQNIYLFPPLGTNYSVTVYARRVNVNAVTANTNDVVQDYALVMSYGDGGVASNAFTVTDGALSFSNQPSVTVVTPDNPLLNERVGGNSQYAGTNGETNQWNFYIFTNDVSGTNASRTNVAFVTFAPPELGVPRIGTREEANPANGVRVEADVDLYVSADSNLLNLNPATLAAANKSLTRTGTEKVLLTNTTGGNQTYYVGVKSEDQQGAQYGFFAGALSNSFGQLDSHGNAELTVLTTLPKAIPPGTPALPGSLTVLAVTTVPVQARKVVVTDTVTHQAFGDLIGALTHLQTTTVLNNHSFFDNGGSSQTFLYDDSGEQDPLFPGARRTDGPGSLQNFVGDHISDGIWTLTMVNDSSPVDVGHLDFLNVVVEPQNPSNQTDAVLPGQSWFYDFVDVPASATNLTVKVLVTTATNPGPVNLYLRAGAVPDQTNFDKAALNVFPVGTVSLSIFDSPPLNPGRYYIGVYNPNAAGQTVTISWTLGFEAGAGAPLRFQSTGNTPILDDAVTDSTINIGQTNPVASVEVGVRIDHPRESDLVLTLISPNGTRALLAENRGGLDTNGYGSGVDITNASAPVASGDLNANTNVINVPGNEGTLVVNYNFFTIPDDMRIYYDGNRIFDSGLISGSGTFSVDFGPGNSTNVSIVMNEPGTNPQNTNNSGDLWTYQASEITRLITYAIFTDDTNKTTLPIKFAPPPFGAASALLPLMTSSFESSAAGDYVSPAVVDGWTVLNTNPVKVVTVTSLASNENSAIAGSNVLALHYGSITRTLPTVAGTSYTLTFKYHGRPVDKPVGWWKGEGNETDSSGNNNNGGPTNSVSFSPGEVTQAFNFGAAASATVVPDSSTLRITNQITAEAWVNPKVLTGDQSILSKVGPVFVPGYGNNGYQFGFASGGGIFAEFNSPGDVAWATHAIAASAPLATGTWYHFAWTYDQSQMSLYLNGNLIQSQVIGPFPINTTPARFFISGDENLHVYFTGLIDEPAIYSNALSILQIQDIYAAGSAGKCLTPTNVTANVTIAGVTNNDVITAGDGWETASYTFVAPSNGTVLTIAPNTNGMLVDSFELTPSSAYLPEESLSKFIGEIAQGAWKLEILDNRAGATNPAPNLISWELNLGLDRINPAAIHLQNMVPNTNSVPRYFSAFYIVDVPPWATNATNILVTADGPVSVVFNQNVLPGTNANDVVLMSNVTSGTAVLTTNILSVPPLVPGQQYYLAVQNLTNTTVHFTIEVDFNQTIIPLTNDQVFTTNFAPLQAINTFFSFTVTNSPASALFELYNLNGDVDLTADQNALPFSPPFFASSSNPGTSPEQIVVQTNGALPNLNATYFLGVPNNTLSNVTFTIHVVVANTNGLLISKVPFNPKATLPGPGATNGPTISWSTVVGQCYEVDYSSDLVTWTALPGTPFKATSTTSTFTDPTPITGMPARFYRILQVTCP